MEMSVEFYRAGRVSGWIATPPHRRPFQGSTMAAGRDIPHDLMQFTIERALDIRDGFWGLLAHGASFASVPGRKPTQDGRALARQYHDALAHVEGIVNGHADAWRRGEETPLRAALDIMYARWLAVGEDERLVLSWPVQPLPHVGVRFTRPHAGRQPRRNRAGR
ncbi:MAG TPA: hypothetical protein VF461_18230 [Gemmatimonadaceae bacterium]